MNLHQACCKVLDNFVEEYTRICDQFDLPQSARLHYAATRELLNALPDEVEQTPYHVPGQDIQDALDELALQFQGVPGSSIALAMHRAVSLCKAHGLIEAQVTITRRTRHEEIKIHHKTAFALMDDFLVIREWIAKRIQRAPRSRADLPELVIAALISINGITLPSAHLKITAARRSRLSSLGNGMVMLDVPTAHIHSNQPPVIQYPLHARIHRLIQHLQGDDDWIFPPNWLPLRKAGKRSIGRKMNRWLQSLWMEILGAAHPCPATWTIQRFIDCSRIHFALEAHPAITACLSGRSVFAPYAEQHAGTFSDDGDDAPRWNGDQTNEPAENDSGNPADLLMASRVIDGVRANLTSFHRKRQNPKAKQTAAIHILAIGCAWQEYLDRIPVLKELMGWIASELQDDASHRRMGTFQGMWTFIPHALVNELENEDPTTLDKGQWERLAEYLIQENAYSPATHKKIRQHLKYFHEYLCRKHPSMERINWRQAAFRVASDPPVELFPTLPEFDRLYAAAGRRPDIMATQMQAALVLAFFGGLRAEEICLLGKMDIDEVGLQVRIWWSKTRKGRRRIPWGLLTPRPFLAPVLRLRETCELTTSPLFRDDDGRPLSPDTLGKRIKTLIRQTLPKNRAMTMHSLRHGFASWLLVRYFALMEPDILTALAPNGAAIVPDADHQIFAPASQKKLVRVFNGRLAGERYAEDPASFTARPEHFAMISRLIGHATRDTTARTYIHTMPWIAHFFIERLASHGAQRPGKAG